MTEGPYGHLDRSFGRTSRAAGGAVVVIGALVTTGWILDVGWLKGPVPGLISMKANTALGFILLGTALLLRRSGAIAPARRRMASAFASTGVLIGTLSLAEYALGRNLGIDELLFRDAEGAAQTVNPGRLAPQTSLNFILLGLALLTIDAAGRLRWASQALALPAAGVSLFAILGYLYGEQRLATVAAFSPIAIHTALACLLLAIGVIAARPGRGLISIVASNSPGGLMARRIVPATLLALPAFGWLRLAGEREGLYGSSTGVALLVVAATFLVLAVTMGTARLLNQAEARREQTDLEQRRLAAVVESSYDAIIGCGADARITTWNRAAELLFGHTAEEALGQPIALIAPENRADEQAQLFGRLIRGERVEPIDTRRRHRNGREIDVALSAFAVTNAAGELEGASVILRDISERKRSESQKRVEVESRLLLTEMQLAKSHEAARVGSWDWLVQSNEMNWSDETLRIHGRSRDEFTPTFEGWLELIHPTDREHAIAAVEEAFATGMPYAFPYKVTLPDGGIRTVHMSGQMVAAEDGTPERLIGTAQDLTEQLRAAAEREQLQTRVRQTERLESVGQLAGGIAHDFNNLLAVILNYAAFVSEELDADHPARADVDEIRRAGERAAALTRQLLMFSRRERVKTEVLDLNAVIADLERLLTRALGEQVDLTTKLDPETWRVDADAGQMEQVLVNLAVNARDAMPQGGRLTIETSNVELDAEFASARAELKAGSYTRIVVTDTGTGMTPEVAGRIFEPFFTTKAKGDGTGLGMATVYGIVAQTGGHIDVYSEPDVGTAFKIYLPAAAGEAAVAREPAAPAAPAAAGQTILLVEDEPAVRELTHRILSRQGYNVLTAASGPEGLETWNRHDGDVELVLTDVVMPGMSGREVAEQIRDLQPGVGVLYMSGYTDDFVARRGIVDDGAPLIEKPFTSGDLLVAVRGVLERV